MMSNISLSLDEIFILAKNVFFKNGCDEETSNILADLIMKAERDGSLSHGLFRVPAYVSGLKSGKINGKVNFLFKLAWSFFPFNPNTFV